MRDDASDHELEKLHRQVEAQPTDLQLRFELGACLFRLNRYPEALAELQRARMNPHCRRAAMELLAQCYQAIGLQTEVEEIRRKIDFEFPDDEEDNPGGAGVPAKLKPNGPRPTAAAKKLPPDEGENA